jgi:hypothetical protein
MVPAIAVVNPSWIAREASASRVFASSSTMRTWDIGRLLRAREKNFHLEPAVAQALSANSYNL